MPSKYIPHPRPSLEERFWSKVNFDGPIPAHRPDLGPCWIWTAFCNQDGYGRVGICGKALNAHRVSFELLVGPIPQRMECCHHCDNPPCVRPAHLFLGTRDDNMADAGAKGRMPRGEGHFKRKLSDAIVRDIRAQFAAGMTRRELAAKYSVARPTIGMVLLGKRWTHVS